MVRFKAAALLDSSRVGGSHWVMKKCWFVLFAFTVLEGGPTAYSMSASCPWCGFVKPSFSAVEV